MKATVKISVQSYRTLWEKAVTQSMKEMECVCKTETVRSGFLNWKKTYVNTPFTDIDKYWDYMRCVWPWNEIDGFKTVSDWNNRSNGNITMSVKLLAATINRAKRWDEENKDD